MAQLAVISLTGMMNFADFLKGSPDPDVTTLNGQSVLT